MTAPLSNLNRDHSAKPASLYPFTYEWDEGCVRTGLADLEEKLAIERRCLARAVKLQREHKTFRPVIAGYRRNIDRMERYRRNGEQRLREIAATRAQIRLACVNNAPERHSAYATDVLASLAGAAQ